MENIAGQNIAGLLLQLLCMFWLPAITAPIAI